MSASVLQPILTNSVPSANAPLVILTDSILQPGLLLLRQVILNSLARKEQLVLISLEQTPSRLLPRTFPPELLTHIDGVSHPPFASTSAHPSHWLNWNGAEGIKTLEERVSAAVEGALGRGKKVTVVLDSIDALAEEGVYEALRIIRTILSRIKPFPNSRLVTLHHHNFPSPSTPPNQLKPDLLQLVLSPSVAATTLHLTLHPPALLSLLSRHYALAIPLAPTQAQPLDLRLTSFLASFSAREWGHPLIVPASLGDEDERCTVDGLSREGGGGRAVVEWEARGLEKDLERLPKGEGRRVVQRGLEGVQRTREGVEECALEEALQGELMKITSTPAPSLPATPSRTSQSATRPTPAPTSAELPLPFNLSLTDAQKAEREKVVMPYLPKELGGTNMPQPIFGASVEYVADEGDDMDDDDPDEDLEV